MLENNVLKSNFLGRDGFRWWIGQIASEEAQGDQINQMEMFGEIVLKFVLWDIILKIQLN